MTFGIGSHDYLQEIPVKLLDVRSMASRYPASNPSYRIKVENGHVCNHLETILTFKKQVFICLLNNI